MQSRRFRSRILNSLGKYHRKQIRNCGVLQKVIKANQSFSGEVQGNGKRKPGDLYINYTPKVGLPESLGVVQT